jgi:hypothetical protein
MTRLPLAASVLGLAAVLAAGVSAAAAAHRADEPVPVRGVPLTGKTGLRLLVADNPPFVLGVDSGRVSRVRGLHRIGTGVVSVVGVGGRSAVVVSDSARDADFYAVRGLGTKATYLGKGRKVVPAAGGRSVWITRVVNRDHCGLRLVALLGQEVGGNPSFPCASEFESGGSLGVVVNRIRILDPRTSMTVLRTKWGVLAAAGRQLVLAGPEREFTLLDAATGAERRFSWPSVLAERHDRAAVDPRGRYVALEFGDPTWQGSGMQVSDVWLLDVRSGSLTQLPGMPAFVSLKRTSLAWTADGRLVLLGESEGRDVVAVWRPGQARLAVKRVRLPERSGGSDSFAPLGRFG